MKVTVDTITAEQIHQLRKELLAERSNPNHSNFDRSHGLFGLGPDIAACFDANNGHVSKDVEWRHAAIVRCVENYNARLVKP